MKMVQQRLSSAIGVFWPFSSVDSDVDRVAKKPISHSFWAIRPATTRLHKRVRPLPINDFQSGTLVMDNSSLRSGFKRGVLGPGVTLPRQLPHECEAFIRRAVQSLCQRERGPRRAKHGQIGLNPIAMRISTASPARCVGSVVATIPARLRRGCRGRFVGLGARRRRRLRGAGGRLALLRRGGIGNLRDRRR